MKNSIKLAALLLLASSTIFAAAPVKSVVPFTGDVVTFSSLPSLTGLNIKVEKSLPGKASVIIYNQNNDVVFKDVISGFKSMEKGYVLNQLEDGDYTIEVFSGKKAVKQSIHVYEDGDAKSFFVVQK